MALSLQRYTSEWRGVQSFEVGNRNSRLFHLLTLKTQAEREAAELISITTYNGHHVPKDLYVDILSWLPVKDVLRFKSVCKEWYAIISTPQFASKHLTNNRYNNDNCLLAQYIETPTELGLFELLLDDTPRVLASKKLWEPGQWNATELCGPCDGLYYVYNGHSFRAVWNPALNELRTLPPIITKPHPPVDLEYSSRDMYGFGCDPLTGDYKVVAIKGYCSTIDDYDGDITHPSSVLVYSLRTDSWKYCGDLAQKYWLEQNNCYIFVKGCCFWLGREWEWSYQSDDENYYELVVSFDIASDTFQEIRLPNYQRTLSKSLGMYDDSLAFFRINEDDGKFDIWTLNQGIWTKKFTVGHVPGVLTAYGHWKTNKVLLQTRDRKLVLCDPNTNETKDLESPIDDRLHGVFAYMESLVSIKGKNNPEKAEDNGEADADIV